MPPYFADPSDIPYLPTLDERADELARLFVTTIFPDLYADNPNCFVPNIYNRMARIAIQAIGEGIV